MHKHQNSIKQIGSIKGIFFTVALLAIVIGFFVFYFHTNPEQVRITKARRDIAVFQTALEEYKNDNGFYPSTQQGLAALVVRPNTPPRPPNWRAGGYLPRITWDPWGRAYFYFNPGFHNTDSYDLYSLGHSNHYDPNVVIGNWQK